LGHLRPSIANIRIEHKEACQPKRWKSTVSRAPTLLRISH
jgi:hypothetical protein